MDNKLKKIDRFSYPNAETFKYKNTRVEIISLSNKGYGIGIKILSDVLTPRAIHSVLKNKIVCTNLSLSKEAAYSIMIGLAEQLKKDGLI